MPCRQHGQGAVGVFGRDDGDHADAHVERLLHLLTSDAAALGDHREHRRGRPGAAIDLGDQSVRDDALQIAGQPAAGDMAERADLGFGGQRQTVLA